jgi:hypothetical protein
MFFSLPNGISGVFIYSLRLVVRTDSAVCTTVIFFGSYSVDTAMTLYNHEVTALLPHKRSPEINIIIIIRWLRSIYFNQLAINLK